MKHVSLEQFSDLYEIMTITQSVDIGFAVTHTGQVEGVPTILISTCRSGGDCYIVQ